MHALRTSRPLRCKLQGEGTMIAGNDYFGSLLGIQVCTSSFPLVRQVPTRTHKKRRTQSESYHRRIQKKWTKRFGTKPEHYALMINPKVAGLLGGPSLVLDPRDVVLLKGLQEPTR